MKALTSNYQKALLWVVAILILAGLWFSCKPASKDRLVGVYTRNYEGVSETLAISADGTFKQHVVYPDGKTWTVSDSWLQLSRGLQLETFYRTFDVEKRVIVSPPTFGSSANFIWEDGKLSHSDSGLYDFVKVKDLP